MISSSFEEFKKIEIVLSWAAGARDRQGRGHHLPALIARAITPMYEFACFCLAYQTTVGSSL
jgi:hypothetical protein